MGTTRRRLLQLTGAAMLATSMERSEMLGAGADQGEGTDIIFTDTFGRPDGPVGNDWTSLRGDWTITDQRLVTPDGPEERVIAQTSFGLGVEFAIEVTLSTEINRWNGLAFNIVDNGDETQDFYAFRVVARSDDRPPSWQLLRVNHSVVDSAGLIASGPVSITGGTDCAVLVSSDSFGLVQLSVREGDDELMSGPQVLPLSDLLSGGHAGIYSSAGGVSASTITVTTSQPPAVAPDPGPLECIPFEGIAYDLPDADQTITATSLVDSTWTGHQVGRALLTDGNDQYVAYYDAERRMTVAHRQLDSDADWVRQPLDSVTGWDSHNYVTMALDAAGHLHVSGNMHVVPLIYFRTTEPGDVTSLTRVDTMIDPSEEQRVTYPRFFRGGDNELIFRHRDGSSGDGVDLYNLYDPESRQWNRLLDQPLHDGEGLRNAYVEGPNLGPDGYYHIAWVWRDSPDAATNQHLSYARSPDLRSWENSDGSALTLPITYGTSEVVDPVPMNGGIINGNTKIGFDTRGRVLLSYHKFDVEGNTQIYVARREPRGWKIRQISAWQGRWAIGGGGSLIFEVSLGAVTPLPDGYLRLDFTCHDHRRSWILSPGLRPVAEVDTPQLPPEISEVRSTFPGMQVNISRDSGATDADTASHLLRWESRPQNKDRPWDPPHPDPGPLEVYTLG